MSGIADTLTEMMRNAPEMNRAPELLASAAQSPDPKGTAQALAHAGNTRAIDKHVRKHQGLIGGVVSFLGRGVHAVEHAAGEVEHAAANGVGLALKAAMAPLQEVQHTYRYLHDVESRHGPQAALLESLGLAVGAGLGTWVGGARGGVLGAEAAGSIMGRTVYTDSWDRTKDGEKYLDRSSHAPVSIGRDVARAIGVRKGTPFHVLSGALDGLAMLGMDPLAQVGSMVGAARSAEGAKGLLALRFAGTAPKGAEDVERIVQSYGSVQRAFADIAKSDAAQIARRYRPFEGIADRLGAAKSVNEVTDVFRDVAAATELTTTNQLPTLSFTRVPFTKLRRVVEDHPLPGVDNITKKLTLLPNVYDPELMKWSAREISIHDNHGAVAIHRMLRWGESTQVADDVVNAYLNAPVGSAERIKIFKNAITKTMTGMVGKELEEANPEVFKEFMRATEELTGGAAAGRSAQYGHGIGGRNLSRVMDEEGRTLSAGITDNQVGKLALPNFTAMKRSAAEFKGGLHLFGAADDWLYENWTQRVFKKMVLLSGGFALRVSAAEAIPAIMRDGLTKYVKTRADVSLGKLAYKIDNEEAGHLAQAVYSLLPKGFVQKDIDRVTEFMALYGGHTVTPALDASHHISAEVAGITEKHGLDIRRAIESTPKKFKMADDFGEFGTGDKHFANYWQRELSELSNDTKSQAAAGEYLLAMQQGATQEEATRRGAAAATKWLDAQDEAHLNKYLRHTYVSEEAQGLGVLPHEDWGRVTMERIKGATHAPDGTPHLQLLRDVSEGTAPAVVKTRKGWAYPTLDSIDGNLRPELIKGRQLLPDSSTALDRIADAGHRKVLNPIINHLAREPIFHIEYAKQLEHLEKYAPEMAREEMVQLAASRATVRMTPHIHNINERSQFSETAKNWMPFYFAQEQAYKRVGRLLAEDPGAFRKYQLLFSSLHDVGFENTDDGGQPHVILPGTGFLTQGTLSALSALGLPVVSSTGAGFSGSVHSLKTISPFLEGEEGAGIGVGPFRANFGPIAAIPAHVIKSLFPESEPAVRTVVGDLGTSGSIWETLIPNTTIKRVIQAFGNEHKRSFQTAMVQTIQGLAARDEANPAVKEWLAKQARGEDPGAYPGLVPPPSAGVMDRQKFIDRVRGQTRILFLVKAAIGAVSPSSPQFELGDVKLRDEVRKEIAAKGNFAEGIDSFLQKHPDATPYTVFGSDNLAGGPVAATQSAMDWVNNNKGLLSKYPNAAAFFVPQITGEKFDQAVYNEQLAIGLRAKKTPEQFLKDVYIASVNQDFFDHSYPTYQAELAAAKESGDTEMVAAVRANWGAYMEMMKNSNPVWFDWFTSTDRKTEADRALTQLRDMFAKGNEPDSPHTEDIRELLHNHDVHVAELLRGKNEGWSSEERQAEVDNWQNYVDSVAKSSPQLSAVINRVFRKA